MWTTPGLLATVSFRRETRLSRWLGRTPLRRKANTGDHVFDALVRVQTLRQDVLLQLQTDTALRRLVHGAFLHTPGLVELCFERGVMTARCRDAGREDRHPQPVLQALADALQAPLHGFGPDPAADPVQLRRLQWIETVTAFSFFGSLFGLVLGVAPPPPLETPPYAAGPVAALLLCGLGTVASWALLSHSPQRRRALAFVLGFGGLTGLLQGESLRQWINASHTVALADRALTLNRLDAVQVGKGHYNKRYWLVTDQGRLPIDRHLHEGLAYPMARRIDAPALVSLRRGLLGYSFVAGVRLVP